MLLYPKADFNNVTEITYTFLKNNNIKALILDVDNTLIDYYKNISEKTIKWVQEIKNCNIKIYLLSNSNKKEKVKKVAETLKVPYKYFAKKPLKGGFLQVQKELKIKPEEIAAVGDQIFTDILGGNRCNMFTILVEPINKKDIWITMWKRPIENYIINKYKKIKGEK